MDPFNAMRENEKGLLKLMLLQPPVVPEDTCGEATIRIKLNMPNLAISACLKSDIVNHLKISMRDGFTLQRQEGRKLVREVLWNSKLLSLSEEVETDGSDRCRLTCRPLTHQRIHTPVRGDKCAHLQCFDLKALTEAYLEINRGIAAFNKRWQVSCLPERGSLTSLLLLRHLALALAFALCFGGMMLDGAAYRGCGGSQVAPVKPLALVTSIADVRLPLGVWLCPHVQVHRTQSTLAIVWPQPPVPSLHKIGTLSEYVLLAVDDAFRVLLPWSSRLCPLDRLPFIGRERPGDTVLVRYTGFD
eukprot:Skav227536  [mRNA]  locus=scaffold3314:170242:181665:+ [translate_table: standard]